MLRFNNLQRPLCVLMHARRPSAGSSLCSSRSGALVFFARLLSTLALVLCIWVKASAAYGQRLVIEIGKGLQLSGTENAESLFVADPTIADIQESPSEAHFIYGKSVGETTVTGVDLGGRTLFQYDMVVIYNLDEMQRMLSQRFPAARITIRSARGSVYATGTVPDQQTYDAAIESLEKSIPEGVLINEIAVAESPIIRLDIKFMEVSRDRLETYGVNWSALSPSNHYRTGDILGRGHDVNKFMKLLLDNGVATILSDTTLTTIGRKKASFMAGEEIAIPTHSVNNGAASFGVDYKFVGFNIGFTPQLLPGDKVSLAIEAEISEPRQTVQFSSGPVPYVAARKLNTNVDLHSGESFILAGLSRMDTTGAHDQPRRNWGVVGEVLRSLAGHGSVSAHNRDIAVVVTPYFGASDKPSAADITGLQRSNIEFILSNKSKPFSSARIYGPAGFLY